MGSAYESLFLDYNFGYDDIDSPTSSPTSPLVIIDDDTNSTSASASVLPLAVLTDGQEMLLSILPIPTAILSVFGSASIIYMACQSRKQLSGGAGAGGATRKSSSTWTPYTRLLIGMSCTDIVFSISYALNAFLLPRETSHRVWAIGNDTTCSALGFFTQFSLSTMLFNGMLSFYFLLTGRYGYKNHEIAHRWYLEPMMHVISLGYPLITAGVGSVLGVYHELEIGLGCWVKDFPQGCEDGPDAPPCKSPLVAYIFAGTILGFAYLSISANNLIIWSFVRQQTKTKIVPSGGSSGGGIATTSSLLSGRRRHAGSSNRNSRVRSTDTDTFASRSGPFSIKSMKLQSPHTKESSSSDKSKVSSSVLGDSLSMMNFSQFTNRDDEEEVDDAEAAFGGSGGTDNDDEDDEEEQATARHNKLVREQQELLRQRQQHKRLRLVSSQARLYVGAFFLSTIWPLLVRILETYNTSMEMSHYETKIYPILLCQNIFFPLQGFWNLLVYVRPKYLKCRREFKLESRFWALRRAMYGPTVEPTAGTYRNAGGVIVASSRKTGKVVKVLQQHADDYDDGSDDDSDHESKATGTDDEKLETMKNDADDCEGEDVAAAIDTKMSNVEETERLDSNRESNLEKTQRIESSQLNPTNSETRAETKKDSSWLKWVTRSDSAIRNEEKTPEPIRRLPREFISSITTSVGDFSESSDHDEDENFGKQKHVEEPIVRRLPREFISSITASVGDFSESSNREEEDMVDDQNHVVEDGIQESAGYFEPLKTCESKEEDPSPKKKQNSWSWVKKKKRNAGSSSSNFGSSSLEMISELTEFSITEGGFHDLSEDVEEDCSRCISHNKGGRDDLSTSSSIKRRVRFDGEEKSPDTPPTCPEPFSPPGRRWSASAGDPTDPKSLRMMNQQQRLRSPCRLTSLSPSSASSPTEGSSSSFVATDECFDRMKAAMEPLNLDAPMRRPVRRGSYIESLDDDDCMMAQTV